MSGGCTQQWQNKNVRWGGHSTMVWTVLVFFFYMDTYMCIALRCLWCLLFSLVYGRRWCHPWHMQQCISWREQRWRRSLSLVVRLSLLRFIVMLLLSIWLISCTFEPARVAKISVFLPWSSHRNCFCSTDDWCWRSDWWKHSFNPSTASCPWLFCMRWGKKTLVVGDIVGLVATQQRQSLHSQTLLFAV